MALSGADLVDYACLKFEEEKYDEALEAFVLAYMKGVEQQWIIETIYSCYMEGNEETFRKTFQCYVEKTGVLFEDCLLDFIPYRDGEYYIFDKEENIFRGMFLVKDFENTASDPVFQEMEFSAAAWEMDWDWRKEKQALVAAKERKVYVICHNQNRAGSFFKIPELGDCWENIKLFPTIRSFQEYFHSNTAEYLPRVLMGKETEVKEIERILEQEHQYRLTPEGRNTDNILLTIGIPTYNRGHLLLERLENLLAMPYDAEVEIAVAKNGTELYQEEYERAGEIQDARFCYAPLNSTISAALNWHRTVEISHGRYVLFVSDEDDVIIESLEHYLKLLIICPKLNQIRAKTTFQYAGLEYEYGKAGIEAFKLMFLTQNYLSGWIVKRKDFLKADLRNLEKYKDNIFYSVYPHAWWNAILCIYGDAMKDPVMLISEGDSFRNAELEEYQKRGLPLVAHTYGENGFLQSYATYEARLDQFQGMIAFLHILTSKHKEFLEAGLDLCICKTAYLLELAREYNYDNENYENMVEKFLWLCMDAIDEFELLDTQKLRLLERMLSCGRHALDYHKALSEKKAEV